MDKAAPALAFVRKRGVKKPVMTNLYHIRSNGHKKKQHKVAFFAAHLPNLQPWILMDMDFVVLCQFVQPEMPHIRFLSVRLRLCYTLP